MVHSRQDEGGLSELTFDRDVNSLFDEKLRLYQHAADIGALVHPLLDITELQGPIFKHHLEVPNVMWNEMMLTRMTTTQREAEDLFSIVRVGEFFSSSLW